MVTAAGPMFLLAEIYVGPSAMPKDGIGFQPLHDLIRACSELSNVLRELPNGWWLAGENSPDRLLPHALASVGNEIFVPTTPGSAGDVISAVLGRNSIFGT